MKKILIFHHYGGLGGAGLSLLHILESIDKSKYEVVVVCPTDIPSMSIEIQKIDKITLHPTLSTPKIFPHYSGGSKFILHPTFIKNMIKLVLDKKEVEKIIRIHKPDIIMTNSMTLYWINKIAKKWRIKNLCFHRETYAKGLFGLRTFLIKKGLSYADAVCFISRLDLNKSQDVDTKKIVIFDKIDEEIYKTNNDTLITPNRNNPIKLLYLGGVSRLKGFHLIIQAFSKLKNSNVRLVVLGGERNKQWNKKQRKYYDNCISTLMENNKLDDVEFHGFTNTPEVFYKEANIIVFPSTKPHQARPIYEAGISNKPIIISDFKETKEFAINEYNVFTFKNGNNKSLLQTIEKVLNAEVSEIERIVKNNYEMAIKNHNLKDLSNEIDGILQYIISSK